MSRHADVPHLGSFEGVGHGRRQATPGGGGSQTVPTLKVARGRDSFCVVLHDAGDLRLDLARAYEIGDRIAICGLQLRDLILTSTRGITRLPRHRQATHLTREQAYAFLAGC